MDGFKPLGFHEGLYFVVVTLFTVGYGDINAVNDLSKICTMLVILLTIGIMPQQTADLLKLFGIWSVYKKIEYNSAELKHVVVTGYISMQAIQNFCKEIFHVDHGDLSTNTVIIQHNDPKSEIVMFMQKYDKNMTYLNGDTLLADDMIRRAKAHKADACILLTNKNSSNSSEEDFRNILIALAVKKFVYDERDSMEDSANIPICM